MRISRGPNVLIHTVNTLSFQTALGLVVARFSPILAMDWVEISLIENEQTGVCSPYMCRDRKQPLACHPPPHSSQVFRLLSAKSRVVCVWPSSLQPVTTRRRQRHVVVDTIGNISACTFPPSKGLASSPHCSTAWCLYIHLRG